MLLAIISFFRFSNDNNSFEIKYIPTLTIIIASTDNAISDARSLLHINIIITAADRQDIGKIERRTASSFHLKFLMNFCFLILSSSYCFFAKFIYLFTTAFFSGTTV